MSALNIERKFYQAPTHEKWQGRIDSDSDPDHLRYHQVVKCEDLDELHLQHMPALIGFASDVGVKRNQGRIGAAQGPAEFRKMIGSLCWNQEEVGFLDVGNISVMDQQMEEAQIELGKSVHKLLRLENRPFIIGGGHETAFGNYLGVAAFLKETQRDARLGILNIDAHFDLRPYQQSSHSGSSFLQAHDHAKKHDVNLKYFTYGINPHNNTRALFKKADALETEYCTNRNIYDNELAMLRKVENFIRNRTHIYLTVCLDVFDAAVAPGVSAPAWNGIQLHHVLRVFDLVKASGKLVVMDVCELNPAFDQDHRTARLAGSLFSEWVA